MALSYDLCPVCGVHGRKQKASPLCKKNDENWGGFQLWTKAHVLHFGQENRHDFRLVLWDMTRVQRPLPYNFTEHAIRILFRLVFPGHKFCLSWDSISITACETRGAIYMYGISFLDALPVSALLTLRVCQHCGDRNLGRLKELGIYSVLSTTQQKRQANFWILNGRFGVWAERNWRGGGDSCPITLQQPCCSFLCTCQKAKHPVNLMWRRLYTCKFLLDFGFPEAPDRPLVPRLNGEFYPKVQKHFVTSIVRVWVRSINCMASPRSWTTATSVCFLMTSVAKCRCDLSQLAKRRPHTHSYINGFEIFALSDDNIAKKKHVSGMETKLRT